MAIILVAAYVIQNQNWAAWFLLAVLSALGFYTVPIMLYPFGGIVVWLLLSAWAKATQSGAKEFAAALGFCVGLTVLMTAVLYGPVLAVSGPKSVIANSQVMALAIPEFLHGILPSLQSTWGEWNRALSPPIVIVLASGFFFHLFCHRRCSRFQVPLALALVLWVVPLVCLQRVIPFERVWLFALPLYLITSAAGLAAILDLVLGRVRLRTVLPLVTLVILFFIALRVPQSIHSIYSTNVGRGLEALSRYLKTHLCPGDAVAVATASSPSLFYYFRTEGVPTSYLDAPRSQRVFVVVSDVTGDSVAKVLETTGTPGDGKPPGRLLVRYDSVSLYEVMFSHRPARTLEE